MRIPEELKTTPRWVCCTADKLPIDPKTGYPALHSLLSATVVARDCMSADAYATACMVMGLKRATEFVESRADIDAYFIYTDEQGNFQTYMTRGMERYLAQ